MAMAKDILDVARSFIGVKESPPYSNNVIFNTHYYGGEVSGSAYPWCCAFVWDVFRIAGASDLFYGGGKTAGCTTLMNYYKNQGQIVTDYKPGDLVFYQFDDDAYSEHIGIIESVGDNSIVAIEGNTSDGGSQSDGGEVLRKTRSKSLIMAVARPKYEEEKEEEEEMTYEDFVKFMEKYEAERSAKPEPQWSIDEGAWKRATEAGVVNGKAPEQYIKRDEVIAVLGRLGQI